MKKLFYLAALLFLAAGCTKTQQDDNQPMSSRDAFDLKGKVNT